MSRPPASDVAIVGGGIVGTAAAAFLSAAGARVTLFEQSAIAAAASGRNSGVIQHPFDPVLAGLYRESLELYRVLALDADESAAFQVGAEPAGLVLTGAGDASDTADAVAAAWRAAYPETIPTILAGAELHRLEPALARDLVGCRLDIGYPVAPGSATRAFATLAVRRGVTIRIGQAVGLAVDGPVATGVLVDGRVEPAEAVVVAAGPWTPTLVDPTGHWRPIRPVWGIVAEVGLAEPPRHVLEEIEIEIEPSDASAAAGSTPDAFGFSLVTAEGATALGSTFLEDQPDPASFVAQLRERGSRYVPALSAAPLRGMRICARPVSFDGRPLVGAVPGLERAFIAAGHGPWGISTGPATARMIADLVLGGSPASVPRALHPGRFPAPTYSGRNRPLPG